MDEKDYSEVDPILFNMMNDLLLTSLRGHIMPHHISRKIARKKTINTFLNQHKDKEK